MLAHKIILAVGNPVFYAMFYGPLKGERAAYITDVPIEPFWNVSQFLMFSGVTLDRIVIQVFYSINPLL